MKPSKENPRDSLDNPLSKNKLKKIAGEESGWQKFIKWRHQIRDGKFIPDPAAAPLGTDQEAGGSITTPEGNIKQDY